MKGKHKVFSKIVIVLFTMGIFLNSFHVYAAQKVKSIPVVKFAATTVTEYFVGDRVKFDIYSPGYVGRVEYRVTLWNDTKKEYKDLWNSSNGFPGGYYSKWQGSGNSVFTLGWPIYEAGSYRITVYAKRVGVTNKDTYLKGQNCDSFVKSLPFVVKPKIEQTKEITSIKLKLEDITSKYVVVGEKRQFEALVLPESTNRRNIKWSVTDIGGTLTNKATIDSDGVLNPIAPGEVFVMVASLDGSEVCDVAKITIYPENKKKLITALAESNTLINALNVIGIGNATAKEQEALRVSKEKLRISREAAISALSKTSISTMELTTVTDNLKSAILSFKDSIITEICATSENMITNKTYTQADPLIIELLIKGNGDFYSNIDKSNIVLQGDIAAMSIEEITPTEGMGNSVILKLTGKTGGSLLNASVKLTEKTVNYHSHGFEATIKKPDKNILNSYIKSVEKLISTYRVGNEVNCVSQEAMDEFNKMHKIAMEVANRGTALQGEINKAYNKLSEAELSFKDSVITEVYVVYDNLETNQTYTDSNPLIATLSISGENSFYYNLSGNGDSNVKSSSALSFESSYLTSRINSFYLGGDLSGLWPITINNQDMTGKKIVLKLTGKTGNSVKNGTLNILQGFILYHKHGFVAINKTVVANNEDMKISFEQRNPLININEKMPVNIKITANKHTNKKIKIHFLLPPQGQFEILDNGKWISLGSAYGPEGGISLSDSIYSIRFAFQSSGRYQIRVEVRTLDGNSIIGSDVLDVHVENRLKLLNDAINRAQEINGKATVGTGIGNVSEESKQAFTSIINEAIAIRGKTNATDAEISTAKSKLSDAQRSFVDSIITIVRATSFNYQANKNYNEVSPLEVHLYLEGTGKFKKDLTAKCIGLGGDLVNFKLVNFERIGDNHIVIKLTGTSSGVTGNGKVIMEYLVSDEHMHGFTAIINKN